MMKKLNDEMIKCKTLYFQTTPWAAPLTRHVTRILGSGSLMRRCAVKRRSEIIWVRRRYFHQLGWSLNVPFHFHLFHHIFDKVIITNKWLVVFTTAWSFSFVLSSRATCHVLYFVLLSPFPFPGKYSCFIKLYTLEGNDFC